MFFKYANYYFNFGFNITCIINERNEFNSHAYDNRLLKSPSHKWENFQTERQQLEVLRSYAWDKAVGIGLVLGYANLRALDIDKCTNLSIFYDFLLLLELPSDYKWVVRSGSQEGFHILFYCDDHNYKVTKDKIRAFKSNIKYSNTFKHVELRWKGHLVLPPSIHPCLMKYQFFNGWPLIEPLTINLVNLKALLKKYCENSSTRQNVFISIDSNEYLEEAIKTSESSYLDYSECIESDEFLEESTKIFQAYLDSNEYLEEATKTSESYLDYSECIESDESLEESYDQIKLKYTDSIDFNNETFLFMDFEAFNLKTKGGRVSQYASLRTNFNLDLIKENVSNFFCEQSKDNIPSIEAALITKLTPQKIIRFKNKEEHPAKNKYYKEIHVFNEFDFIKNILDEMKRPQTCTLGYNSYNFDDEFTRNLAFRNLFDPYEREWLHGNSRFDVYFLILATYVLRPNLIKFPQIISEKSEKVEVSFELNRLTEANNIDHLDAHDAFSDVVATILLMKLIKTKDEEFFNSIFKFRNKLNVLSWLESKNAIIVESPQPFIHISAIYGKQSNILAPLIYICDHPKIKTRLICVRLDQDNFNTQVDNLLKSSGEEILENIFSKSSVLEEKNSIRFPINFIDVNKCPILAMIEDIDDSIFNKDLMNDNLKIIQFKLVGLKNKFKETFNQLFFKEPSDSDLLIYSGFFNPKEKFECKENVNYALKGDFSKINCKIRSPKLKEMIFKFKARNFPKYLSNLELIEWERYRYHRLNDKSLGAEITFDDFFVDLAKWQSNKLTEKEKDLYNAEIINEIEQWVKGLAVNLAYENEIKIGNQIWTTKNLDVETYRNGDAILQVKSTEEWDSLSTGAWCYYEDKGENGTKYGKLYNWYAVNDPRGLAPKGYHIPTDQEWTILADYLDGESKAGTKMKSTNGWVNNGNGTNTSGFEGFPGGYRCNYGSFSGIGEIGIWWSLSEATTYNVWIRLMVSNFGHLERGGYDWPQGHSVRCLRD